MEKKEHKKTPKKTGLKKIFQKKKSELRVSPGSNNPNHFDFKKLKIKKIKKMKFGKV